MSELYELTLTQSYFGQVCINRWNYLTDSIPAGASLSQLLVEAFGALPENAVFPADTVFSAIRDVQSTAVNYVAIECFNIYVVTDFYSTPFPSETNGLASGEAMSPVSAYGFRSTRSRRDIRRGTKRFVGTSETHVGAGGIVGGVFVPTLETLSQKMGQIISIDDDGNTISFQPCIVKKEPYVVEKSGNTSYRYYPDKADQLNNIATSILWQAYPQIRTQTSRQYGRGV